MTIVFNFFPSMNYTKHSIMSHHFAAINRTKVPCVLPLALYFQDLFPELRLYRTHFYYSKEYLNVYLGLRVGAMELELDVYEHCYKLKLVDGQFKETVRPTAAPKLKNQPKPIKILVSIQLFSKKNWFSSV
ncbi:hypothetical protein M9H77_22937 [Catharanthus roseus]|uniref:Uncharacterized protein n=1 Tax=Catharanthus roseus TaxID=4058 RepID=A0ACC0AU18_CATRO|nr:hypothetical protein M9H77_22937 [Catharanthus roseus]